MNELETLLTPMILRVMNQNVRFSRILIDAEKILGSFLSYRPVNAMLDQLDPQEGMANQEHLDVMVEMDCQSKDPPAL